MFSFPEWQPHFSFLDTPHANEMMALRWLTHLRHHLDRLALFFQPGPDAGDEEVRSALRIKIYPELMSGAMGWFRSSAFVTVLVWLALFLDSSVRDARLAEIFSLIGKWFGWWLLVWLVAYIFIYALQLPAKGIFPTTCGSESRAFLIVVIAASWLVLALNGGPNVSNAHLAISVGGGLGLIMLRILGSGLAHTETLLFGRARLPIGHAHARRNGRLMRWNYLTARTSFWLLLSDALLHGAPPATTRFSAPSAINRPKATCRRKKLYRADN